MIRSPSDGRTEENFVESLESIIFLWTAAKKKVFGFLFVLHFDLNFVYYMQMNDNDTLSNETETSTMRSLDAYYAGDDNRSKVIFEFVLHGVFLNLIGVVGLVGNGLCIAVLTRPQMRSSTNLILTALATFDSVVIATSMLMLR